MSKRNDRMKLAQETLAIIEAGGYAHPQSGSWIDICGATRVAKNGTELIQPENHTGAGDPMLSWVGMAPAGRLDIDSQGLLVLTQDGRVARKLIGADSIVEKEYLIWVEGDLGEGTLDRLREGLSLDGKRLKRAGIKKMDDHHLQFTLTEGRKRQIRRMCELVDLQVTRLMRVRIGDVRLENLPVGKWRYLRQDEQF